MSGSRGLNAIRKGRERASGVALILCAAAALGACGSSAVHHRVKAGENLYRIGKAYGVSVQELSRANDLSDPSRILVGQKILIPGAERALPVDVIAPKSTNTGRTTAADEAAAALKLQWPVRGAQVSSPFGARDGNIHDGVDISAPIGTPIYAAAAGEVIYADSLRGYGNVIILRHDGGYATVYAHNAENLARLGQKVKRGEQIATLGDSGRTTGANLHFEVRRDNVARDPLPYLPPVYETVQKGDPKARR